MEVLRQRSLTTGAVWLTGLAVAGVSLWVWFLHDPAAELRARLPGGDGTPEGAGTHEQATNLSGTFQQFDGTPADLPGAWPQFRGPDGNNIRPEGPPLADAWEENGPSALWTLALGEGYASPAVLNGRVYVLDYDETEKADAIRCFSLDAGREIWRRSYSVSVKRNHGMSRTVPAVTDRYVVTLGPRCHVVCLDAASGDFRWGLDLVREYGTNEPLWYAGQCPIIEEGRAILAPCGPDVLMMAVDCETGSVVWKTPNPKGWDMSHSSITPATIAGKRMYVYCAVGGVTGVSAETADAGQILWQLPWNARVIAPSPVPLDQDRVCLTAGYGEGGMMIRVRETGGTFSAEVLHKYGPKDGLSSEQHTPIWHDGLLYSIMPKDAGALRSQFVCYNPEGQLIWSSGQNNRFGLGPFVLADGKFYLLSDDGLLTMVRASRGGYEPLQQAQVLHGQEAWGPIAVVEDRMLLRDSKQLACLYVGANREAR